MYEIKLNGKVFNLYCAYGTTVYDFNFYPKYEFGSLKIVPKLNWDLKINFGKEVTQNWYLKKNVGYRLKWKEARR